MAEFNALAFLCLTLFRRCVLPVGHSCIGLFYSMFVDGTNRICFVGVYGENVSDTA